MERSGADERSEYKSSEHDEMKLEKVGSGGRSP